MCVIMLVNNARPTKEMIEKAWATNDDGGGIAWRERGEVYWQKGLMEKEDGLDKMLELCKKVPTPYVAHFRIASIGGPSKVLTHPFPIDVNASLDLEGHTKGRVLFHNGHWGAWCDRALEAAIGSNTAIPEGGEWSDTRAMAWLCHIYGPGFMKFLPAQKGIIMGPKSMDISPGDGWVKLNDVWCSNDFFMKRNGRTVYSYRMCHVGQCTRPVVPGKNVCSDHDGTTRTGEVVPESKTEKEVKQAPVPFKSGELMTLSQAEILWRRGDISKSLLKKFRQEYHRLTGKGPKADKARKNLVLHTQTVMALIDSNGQRH